MDAYERMDVFFLCLLSRRHHHHRHHWRVVICGHFKNTMDGANAGMTDRVIYLHETNCIETLTQ